MVRENIEGKKGTETHKILGLMFLALALVPLVYAALMQGTDESQLGIKAFLIIIGGVLTFVGAAIYWLGKSSFMEETEHLVQNTEQLICALSEQYSNPTYML